MLTLHMLYTKVEVVLVKDKVEINIKNSVPFYVYSYKFLVILNKDYWLDEKRVLECRKETYQESPINIISHEFKYKRLFLNHLGTTIIWNRSC